MNVGRSVSKSIKDWEEGDLESAMLHACNAVDGTARKLFPSLANAERFTRLLRENYMVLGPMGMPHIDIWETRFPIKVRASRTPDGKTDLADVIYGVHRCSHGHGDEIPEGFDLIQDAGRVDQRTRVSVSRGKIQLSDRVIFGIVAVAVLAPVNRDQRVPDGYFLTYNGDRKFIINDWWGRKDDFVAAIADVPLLKIKLDFGEWME